jgi:hypothetical protein
MKLEKILDRLGSIEKNNFIKAIDAIISNEPKNAKQIEDILNRADKGLKSVDNENIATIFSLVEEEFYHCLEEEFCEASSQLDILIDILIRDGNCIMKLDWFSRLYEAEIKSLNNKIKKLNCEFANDKSEIPEERKRDYQIYKACLSTAYRNDIENNRETKITSDEQSILLTLASQLELSQEEIKLINYSILPVEKFDTMEVINQLKGIGVIFFSKKENTLYVADEMVRLLRELRDKEVADKFIRRTLRVLREPVINHIAKKHNIDKSLSIEEKIEEIIKEGVSFRTLLSNDIFKNANTLNEKKKILNEICEKNLNIQNLKGATLDDKIDSLIAYFEGIERDENINISLDGYEKLLTDLNETLPLLNGKIREKFQIQDEFVLKAGLLIDYNIKPRDILDVIDKDEIKQFVQKNGIKQRGDDILNILEHFKDAENLYLENYEKVAYRDLNSLKESGILVKESELGLKFEDLTRKIFTELGFNINDDLRKKINTSKDQMDILIETDNGDVIIVECKTQKERGYNKFSTVSRQLGAYKKQVERQEYRIAKILLVGPEFSDDFITDCEMNTELNLSLLTASSLLKIYEAFKDSKYNTFPHILFRDVLINDDRIIKALSK